MVLSNAFKIDVLFAFERYAFELVASERSACGLVANVVLLSFLLLIVLLELYVSDCCF